MIIGIAVLAVLGLIPLVSMMVSQGKINIDRPEKRTYIFEDDQGDQYNPFETEEHSSSTEWKYH